MSFRIFNTLFLSILFLSFGFTQDRITYHVDGTVLLEGGDNHEGVEISFYNLLADPPSLTDSTFSDASGFYEIDIEPGYYLVEWTNAGYVPWELGGFALGADTSLDSVLLIPGEVITVTGEQSGNWTTAFQYWVEDTVTVPEGETLTIDAGVRVKFLQGAGMVCNGTLQANGTEDEHVLFTSKQPTPLPGDWDNIELYGENNVISYVDYEFATDGFSGDGASGSTFDHLAMVGSLSLTANGIYLPNSPNSSFTNNNISVAGEYGIFAENNFVSVFDNNTINGATYGVRAVNCDNCSFINNDINISNGETDFGITAHSSPGISLDNNTIIADEQGIYVDSSPNATITNNHITGRIYWNGIMFGSSDSSLVENNHVERTISNEEDGSWQYVVYGEHSEGSIIRSNSLISPNLGQNFNYHNMALRCEWSIVDSNYIEFYMRRNGDHYVIHDDRNSDITNNIINSSSYTGNNTNNIIRSYSNGDYVNTIEGNTINYDYQGYQRVQYAIWTQDNTIVRNNTISCDDLENAIYVQSNCIVENNEINGDYSSKVIHINGNDVSVYSNTINQTGVGSVIWFDSDNGIEIYDNIANTTGAKFLSATASEVSVHHNLIQTSSGRGIEIYNQSGGDIYNNTLISSSGDYGVYIHDLTELPVRNNIIVGFQNGIRDDNDLANTNLRYNDMFDISGSQYLGTGLPVMIGQYVSENDNGDPIDIYGNMNLDPSFALPSEGNYELQLISPCINAGDPSITDPDGSVSDIGAFYKDASIEEDVYGCMDETACNYNAGATLDNGDCTTATTWYWDEDGDGLGYIESTEIACDQPNGFVSNSDDSDPQCATNDTDECGICAGGNLDQDCNGDCFGEATTDDCEVCSGGLSEHEANSDQDCNGECFGGAFIDGCSICVGGLTELEECPEDCNAVFGGTAFWDDCQVCSGGDTEHEANSDMDCAGVCYGDNIGDSFDGCCLLEAIDDCGECDGNGWDLCDADGDGTGNYEQWGYGAHDLSIIDVPDDQGGWVEITFSRSYYDTDTLRSVEAYTVETNYGNGWMNTANGTAYGSDQYTYQVHTQVDSSSSTDGLVDFRVIAGMDEGNFESETVSGYSVDNISPIVPNQMSASSTGNNVSLSWNYEMESDFEYHQVTSLFETAYTAENSYEFILNDGDNNEHWVNAFDTHDNVSENSQSLMSKKLHAGANLISFNVLPDDNSIENVMASIEGNATGVIGEGVAANYMEGLGWMGSLDEITSYGAYWLIVNEEDILLTTGYPTDRTIPCVLHASANLIGYPYRYPTSIEEALPEDIGCDISGIICEGVAAICTESGWVGSLSSLEGSYGCWFIAEVDMEITFNGCDEQECASLSRQSQNLSTVPEGYEYKQSTTQAFYFIESIENIEIGNWILAYNGDEVIGARQWTGRFIDLPAMGDDGSDHTKGYMETGEVPSFKILRGDELINLEGDIPSWENNQLYMVESLTEAVALPETFSLDRAYPNPFNPTTTLSFAIPVNSEVFLSVYNLQGREVVSLINGNMDAGYHSLTWNADSYSSGVYFVKMVAGEFVNTQKLMLVK